jgi:hypothetical protein
MSRVTYTNTPDRQDQVQLRAVHGVRPVSDAEEGSGVHALPGGVYGYTYSPGLPNAPLFASRRYRSYEVHKLATGETVIVAYADAATTEQIAYDREVTVRVQPEPTSDATVLVLIPYSRIQRHRQYAAPNQDGFLVTLSAAEPFSTGRPGSADHSDHEPP